MQIKIHIQEMATPVSVNPTIRQCPSPPLQTWDKNTSALREFTGPAQATHQCYCFRTKTISQWVVLVLLPLPPPPAATKKKEVGGIKKILVGKFNFFTEQVYVHVCMTDPS